MTFHKPSIRLAGLYLAIMMGISIFFSINIYQLSVQEFDPGLHKPDSVLVLPGNKLPDTIRQKLLTNWEAQYQEAKERVVARLVAINAVILIGGGVLSYYLARRTLQPIEEAHDSQARFTADASHELRTPIAAMQSETEVALMDPQLSLDQAKDRLQSNLEELGKLTTLTEGLLRLARLENHDLRHEYVDLDSVVQQAVSRVLPAAEAKKMLIKTPDNIDAGTVGDHDSLVEALVTILDNAIKYSHDKTEITVQLSRGHHYHLIRVADQGVGIKATELPHIFDRFYRADTARSKQHRQGYGLGLAIAKNIIDAHHGAITVASNPGQGTSFTIKLPIR